ncbi:hypothetical protein [Flammeovirga sp. SJP92]|uniref:hypothetical protein n=1 Tax=Flammeovirga sp. SJP92 TaxID=1775430 RepID=UPI000788ECC0|nr:hypothetical protein [Flammeovirga sp. SJP92]KXX69091.1 hypothetical protein AVL50_16770 [Flammeovirga sp. SJP92]
MLVFILFSCGKREKRYWDDYSLKGNIIQIEEFINSNKTIYTYDNKDIVSQDFYLNGKYLEGLSIDNRLYLNKGIYSLGLKQEDGFLGAIVTKVNSENLPLEILNYNKGKEVSKSSFTYHDGKTIVVQSYSDKIDLDTNIYRYDKQNHLVFVKLNNIEKYYSSYIFDSIGNWISRKEEIIENNSLQSSSTITRKLKYK